MKKLIVYATGGTGNRLRPIASAAYMAKKLDRGLFVYWSDDVRCPAEFNDLFKNKINIVNKQYLLNLENVTLYVSQFDVDYDCRLYNRDTLQVLANRHGICPVGINAMIEDDNKDVIFMSNTFLQQVPMQENINWLKGLKPVSDIQNRIDDFLKQSPLGKNIIGCSVRGSDINIEIGDYNWQFENVLQNKKDYKLYICSDDEAFENYFVGRYWDRCIRYKKKFYSHKVNPQLETYHDNITTTKEGVKEGIINMYHLAKTNIQIYYKESSFVQIAKILGDQCGN